MQEIEAKILEIDTPQVVARIKSLGGKLRFSGTMVAQYYDHPALGLRDRKVTLRLRLEGDKTVLALKTPHPSEAGVKVEEETETHVSDPDAMRQILAHLGFHIFKTLEKHRDEYTLGAAHLAIDTYHGNGEGIPTFLEIEAASIVEVHRIAAELGFSAADCRPWTGRDLFKHYGKG